LNHPFCITEQGMLDNSCCFTACLHSSRGKVNVPSIGVAGHRTNRSKTYKMQQSSKPESTIRQYKQLSGVKTAAQYLFLNLLPD